MEDNYNNMVYGDQEFKTFAEIFNYGLSLCKWWKKKKAQDFFTAYIYYLYNVNSREDVPTIEYAEQCAKKNFGYFAGYYGDDVRKKVYKYFEAVHPVFGNRYNVTNKEAFYVGMKTVNHEYYVSLEVARLLKEAGFDWKINSCYNCYGISTLSTDMGVYRNYNEDENIISAPTLDVAQRWLREVKNIDINILVESISSHKQYLISIWFNISSNSSYDNIVLNNRYITYEEAQEAGIEKALEIILKKEK